MNNEDFSVAGDESWTSSTAC